MSHFLNLFFASILSLLAIGFLANAPIVEAACNKNPTIYKTGQTDGIRSVTYHLRIESNCSGAEKYRISVSHIPNRAHGHGDILPQNQSRFFGWWQVEKANGQYGSRDEVLTRNINGSLNIDIRVTRDIDRYNRDGEYFPIVFKVALDSNTSLNDTKSYNYVVKNRPDLEVSKFIYPGGNTCLKSNPTVIIRNQGWASTTQDMTVRVNNGNGNIRDHRVTQKIDGREIIDLSKFFRAMGRPPVGEWTAKAIVDALGGSRGEILEENENDNEETSEYTTTPCNPDPDPDPDPDPGTYFIKGGVFIDSDGNGIKDPGEFYDSRSHSIIINGELYSSGSTGFTSNQLTPGNYSVSFNSLPTGYELTFPPIYIPPPPPPNIPVTIGATCDATEKVWTCEADGSVSNVNFGIRPRATIFGKWFNGIGGDVRVDNGMENIIPLGNFFSEEALGKLDHGVVFGTDLNLGVDLTAERANKSGWYVEGVRFAPSFVNTSYTLVASNLSKKGALQDAEPFINACIDGSPNCNLADNFASGIYKSEENQNINIEGPEDYEFGIDKQYIFLISGNLTINTDLTIPNGSSAIFIVKGDIIIGPDVTQLDGIYSTDNNFTVEGNEAGLDEKLNVGGSIIVNAALYQYKVEVGTPGRFISNRDLGDGNDEPSVQATYRPDYILNASPLIRISNYVIKEVAPGR